MTPLHPFVPPDEYNVNWNFVFSPVLTFIWHLYLNHHNITAIVHWYTSKKKDLKKQTPVPP